MRLRRSAMLELDQGFELEIGRGPGSLSVKVNKLRRDTSNPPPLAESLWALLEQHFTYRMLLDLGAVKEMDDYLVDQMFQLSKRVHEHDGTLHICGLSERNQQVLRDGCHEEAVSCYRNSEEATKDCRCFGRPK
jgi:hypothetical protein